VRNITWLLTENSILFTGELTRHTVPNIPHQLSKTLLTNAVVNASSVVLDFKSVSTIDTAGLAWLLLQVEHAQAANCQLHFTSLPSALIKLAQLSSVEEFLPHLAD
jgi:phospholipid transport system transporter-binding protein